MTSRIPVSTRIKKLSLRNHFCSPLSAAHCLQSLPISPLPFPINFPAESRVECAALRHSMPLRFLCAALHRPNWLYGHRLYGL